MRHSFLRWARAALAVLLPALLLASPAAQADTYTYDVFGNLSTLSSDRGTRSFTYDEINRLKTETGFTGTRAHAYDANTNRTSDGATPPTLLTYTPASNRIATANGVTLTHDEAGNLLADGIYTYTWDEAGRLATVSKNGTLLATYAYDYRNRRSRKSTTAAAPQGAQTVLYHYDQGDHLIAETRSDGTPLRTYVWLAERPLTVIEHDAVSNPPRSLHLQHDHLGTPRLAKNDAGVIQWRWDSDGYGTTAPNDDPDGDGKVTVINLRFPGQYYDQESGLYYNWNRYYSPRLGRYLSPDPIGIEGGPNGYAYAAGNPLSLTDPEGLAYYCTQPLHAFPGGDFGGLGPLHHGFVCNDQGVCGGQDRAGNALLSSGSSSQGDNFSKAKRADRCEYTKSSQCENQCISDEVLSKTRPAYTVIPSTPGSRAIGIIGRLLGTAGTPLNCQDWAKSTITYCKLKCTLN